MPRRGPFIHQVHIADGFADDCDELIHRCLKVEAILNYQTFSSIWKEMNFGCLYEGRLLGAEIAELSEEVIHIGKHYMLKNTSNFEESVAGLFIVYALLNLQPYKGFACLRIVPEDLPAIHRIDMVARRDKRFDVLYILGSVLIKGPVQYHAAERERGMELALRKNLEGYTSIDKLGLRPKGVFYRQNEELDILREIGTITQRYTQAKQDISQKQKFDRNLKYINENLATEMQDSLKKIISGIIEDEADTIKDKGEDDQLKIRRAIKDKAMRQYVNPVRHLVGANDKDEEPSMEESPIKGKGTKRGKGRGCNSKTLMQNETCNSKRKIPISPRAFKKSRLYNHIDDDTSSSESDYEEKLDKLDKQFERADKNTADTAAKNIEDGDDINRPVVVVENNGQEEEQEVHLDIEDLPILIRSDDTGQLYQIELIDEYKDDNKKPECDVTDEPLEALKQLSMISGLSVTKLNNKEDEPVLEPVPSTSKDMNPGWQVLENEASPLIPKLEKRLMKRVHLHSKFKRMGILPVANFSHPEIGENAQEKAKELQEETRNDNDETVKS